MEWLRYNNQGAIRSQPLAPKLVDALSFLPELGVEMEVFSGGQAAKGSGGPRTGSTRHDHGNAADADFYYKGRKLDWNNPEDVPIFQEMVRRGKQRGLTGWGAGDDYMGAGRLHVGFGNPGIWGADGKGANAPGWLREAYHGEPGHVHQPGDENQKIADATMAALGKPPQRSAGAGLLGSEGNDTMTPFQPEQKPRGLLGGLITPEAFARFQMAAEGMSLRPNEGVMKAAESTLQTSADKKKANRTAEWLAQNGRDDLAQAVASGAIDAKTAVAEAMKKPDPTADLKVINGKLVNIRTREVVGDYSDPEKPATSDDIREYQFARQQGYEGGFQDWLLDQRKAGASQTTIHNGSEVGTIPQGYELFTDPETGARRLRVLEGGPEDTSDKDDARAQSALNASDTITTAAKRAREATRNQNLGAPGTSIAGVLPWTDSAEKIRQTEVLRSIAAAENINQMRQQSPTGGALGNASDADIKLLKDKSGALDPNSPTFLRDLDDYERTLLRTVHGREAGDRIYEMTREPTTGGDKPKRLKYNPDTGALE